VLVERPPEALARDVHLGFYYVYTRDDTMLGCAQLKRYSPEIAEIGCLVVAPAYRRRGCGDALLSFVERTSVAAGVQQLFALSTHTMQWFVERGFEEAGIEALPETRRAQYNEARASKIYLKNLIREPRLMDAEELFWSEDMKKEERERPARGPAAGPARGPKSPRMRQRGTFPWSAGGAGYGSDTTTTDE
jgi:amino-acid N-acetyltransferase